MTDPNAGASPQSVADAIAGTDGNGNALPWRVVPMLFDARLLGLSKDYAKPESGNTSTSVLDQVATLAKVLTRTHKHADGNDYDVWDAVQTVLKWVLAQNPHINDNEINSVNYKPTP